MQKENPRYSRKHLMLIAFLSWLSMLGFDFFLHAGLLASLYVRPSPFLLPPLKAFQLIPVGYLSFLLLAILLIWLMFQLKIVGSRPGFIFRLRIGALAWGAFTLGLLSISTANIYLLIGWFLGQTVELAIAGAVIGNGFAQERLARLSVKVIVFFILCIIIAVTLQTLGLAPATRL